ncbi:MAG: DUF169 domain-containing protein [Candidatus Latescibacteria bacterium]|nr:DUF169 domain-containing protein [Candidatus Latescibacterota bacterium]
MTLSDINDAIERHVRPQTFPLAIRMVKEGESLPARTRAPGRDLGRKFAICQSFTVARRYGWSLAVSRDDLSCPLAQVAFGFQEEMSYYTEGNLCAGMYTETPEAGARTEATIEKWPLHAYRSVLVAPLGRAEFDPHVICVYGNSAQVMRLVIAALYKRGGRIESSTAGRIDCSDIVIRTMKSGHCQFILPCYGDRIFGQTADDEMAFAMPLERAAEVVEGLVATQKHGIRYPIPSFLRYQGEFPETYQTLEQMWEGTA